MPFYVWSCEPRNAHLDTKVEQTMEQRPVPVAPKCECGELMERDYTREATSYRAANGYPYDTKNISGKMITVTDPGHEAALCKIHGVAKRDDSAWVDKEYKGYNWKTDKQEYSEGSGMGMPGVWI